MGNVIHGSQKHANEVLYLNTTQHHGHPDYRPHSHTLPTSDAPWNVTQWIDPFDPHPKMVTMPVVLVIRK